jgi:membrane protease YdiL (CAAX protease family)
MKAEKIISLLAFIYNTYISVSTLLLFLKLNSGSAYKDFKMPFPWYVLVAFIFAIGSLAYWFYLNSKEKKGKEAKFALAISLILLLRPQCIVSAIAGLFSKSIYDQLGNIK